MEREPNTQYVLSYSYGKDSGACIHVIMDILGWPLDRIVTADVWATKDIPAVLPEMWEWQQKADEIILQRYGIPVEHFCATKKAIPLNVGGYKYTFEDHFYERMQRGGYAGNCYGFPKTNHGWCKKLKLDWLPNWQRETDLRGYLLSGDVAEEQDISEICRGGVLQRQRNSNVPRISDAEGELVQLRTQGQRSTGSHTRLEVGVTDSRRNTTDRNSNGVFFRAPWTGGNYKYCPVHRDCGR